MDDLNKILSSSVKKGFILGIAFILFTTITYISDIHLFSISTGIAAFIIVFGGEIVYSIISAKRYRNELGGKITYLQVATYIFSLMLVASIINAIFNYALYNLIDPDYLNMQVEYFAEDMADFISGDQLEETLAKMDEKVVEMKEIGGMLLQSGTVSIVMSLILALFIKKDINDINE